jgi:hypothetical protein
MTVQTRKTTLELVGVKRKSLEEYRNGDYILEARLKLSY